MARKQAAFTAFNFDIPDEAAPISGWPGCASGDISDPYHATRARKTGWAKNRGNVGTPAILLRYRIRGSSSGSTRIGQLRAGDERELASAVWNIGQLHFVFRAGLIQRRYDLDTQHGTVQYDQQVWTARMSTCLASPQSTQIGGFWL